MPRFRILKLFRAWLWSAARAASALAMRRCALASRSATSASEACSCGAVSRAAAEHAEGRVIFKAVQKRARHFLHEPLGTSGPLARPQLIPVQLRQERAQHDKSTTLYIRLDQWAAGHLPMDYHDACASPNDRSVQRAADHSVDLDSRQGLGQSYTCTLGAPRLIPPPLLVWVLRIEVFLRNNKKELCQSLEACCGMGCNMYPAAAACFPWRAVC